MKPFSPKQPIAQTLAIQSQIHLPGTVGRILKQIRDLEHVAPVFVRAGLVRTVERPNPLNVFISGIATGAKVKPTIGGFLFAAAAVRIDLSVEHNALGTVGQDSICEIDDIGFTDQAKRLQLINIRQAYALVERALDSPERHDMIVVDCPLLLNRSMVPTREDASDQSYKSDYERTVQAISAFWEKYRPSLFPWNPEGCKLVSLASENYSAIIHVAQEDLRTSLGRSQILSSEKIDTTQLQAANISDEAVASIGEARFMRGILNAFTRTAAYRVNVRMPRMEPNHVTALGVLGLHFKTSPVATPLFLQLIGDEPLWDSVHLNFVVGQLMALTINTGKGSPPIPIQLAGKELNALEPFLDFFQKGVFEEINRRDIEDHWLSNWGEFD